MGTTEEKGFRGLSSSKMNIKHHLPIQEGKNYFESAVCSKNIINMMKYPLGGGRGL